MRAVHGLGLVLLMGACEASMHEGSRFEVSIEGAEYEVLPVARDSIAAHAESLLIDLRRPDVVYLIDGTAPAADLIRTPLVCPNGMRTNVADFLLGQAIGWGERGAMIALSSIVPERVTRIVEDVVDACALDCRPCPDGATLCTQVGDCDTGVSELAVVWFAERLPGDEPQDDRGDPVDPPAWNGPPGEPDPTPYTPDDGGDPWSGPGAGSDDDWGDGDGSDDGGGGGGWYGGGAGGPGDPW
ncbi:MAG: hypothetical protein IT385_17765 [Deltaproteobacteria bacterium]|nr:hypothetical protein [Deltaproteobacteria bacterium]